jgi:hypothetical protein
VKWDSKFQFLSVTGKGLYELSYKNNRLFSAGIIKTKATDLANHKEMGTNTITCIDWYLVTTYYDEYGNISYQTEEYVGQTCGECDNPMYESMCPDGGGSGGGNETDYEYESSYTWIWNVYSYNNGSTVIKSSETVKGRYVYAEPQHGHFTGLSHNQSFASGPSSTGAYWQEAQIDLAYLPQAASSHIIGTLTVVNQPPNGVENTKNAAFSDFFHP